MDRRRFLTLSGTGLTILGASTALARPVMAQGQLSRLWETDLRGSATDAAFSVQAAPVDANSERFQALINKAASSGTAVFLPAGTYRLSNISLPDGLVMQGVPGQTKIVYEGNGSLFHGQNASRLTLRDLVIDGGNQWLGDNAGGLVHLNNCANVELSNIDMRGSLKDALYLERCSGRISQCALSGAQRFGLFAVESNGLDITGNSIRHCSDGGIIVHRWAQGADNTRIIDNRISQIGAASGGTGQWGNGINVFRTDNVRISGNMIEDCAFSAIRANSARNIQISENQCMRSGETAIYSEFSFENAVIANNLVDGGTLGISATNMNEGGHGATITGNIIRNLHAKGPYPAMAPGFGIGIAVEADSVVSGNLIDGAPLYGINVGWGPNLRNVIVSANIVRNARVGIAISVADGAGNAAISANTIEARQAGIIGHRWTEELVDDYLLKPQRAPGHIQLIENRAS